MLEYQPHLQTNKFVYNSRLVTLNHKSVKSESISINLLTLIYSYPVSTQSSASYLYLEFKLLSYGLVLVLNTDILHNFISLVLE